MFGPRLTTIFASRWRALWWAAGVLLTAYCSVPSPDAPSPSAAPAARPQHTQTDPWALPSKPADDHKRHG